MGCKRGYLWLHEIAISGCCHNVEVLVWLCHNQYATQLGTYCHVTMFFSKAFSDFFWKKLERELMGTDKQKGCSYILSGTGLCQSVASSAVMCI